MWWSTLTKVKSPIQFSHQFHPQISFLASLSHKFYLTFSNLLSEFSIKKHIQVFFLMSSYLISRECIFFSTYLLSIWERKSKRERERGGWERRKRKREIFFVFISSTSFVFFPECRLDRFLDLFHDCCYYPDSKLSSHYTARVTL